MTDPTPDGRPGGEADDEDALSWAGDEDRGRERAALPTTPEAAPPADPDADAGVDPPRRSVLPAVFALPYLVLTVSWVLAVQHTVAGTTELGAQVLWQFGEFLAIVAAPLWFAAVLVAGRDTRPGVRLGWFLLGLGILVPWPLVLVVLGALAS